MTVVDAHCHASDVWFEPVETLLFAMDRSGVDRAVVVQVLGQFDNAYLIRCRERHGDRLSVVGAIDPQSGAWRAELQSLRDAGAVGVRLNAGARSTGEDPAAIWRACGELDLAVSVAGPGSILGAAAFANLAAEVSQTRLALEHLGGLARPDFDASDETRARIMALAVFPNISLKAPGLGQLAKRVGPLPSSGPTLPRVAAHPVLNVIDAFGAQRVMWGSDFPPVASREGYASALEWMRDAIAAARPESTPAVFGETAARVFKA